MYHLRCYTYNRYRDLFQANKPPRKLKQCIEAFADERIDEKLCVSTKLLFTQWSPTGEEESRLLIISKGVQT